MLKLTVYENNGYKNISQNLKFIFLKHWRCKYLDSLNYTPCLLLINLPKSN